MYEKPRFWRPTTTLARWVCGVLVLQAMVNIVCSLLNEGERWARVHTVFDSTDVGSSVFSTRLQQAMDTANSGWFSVASYAMTAALVLYVVWSWRSANNALALGRTGARQSPGWVIAGWLVPFLNFVLPYQTMSDLWRSSAPDVAAGDDWRARHSSGRVAMWWVTYLVGSLGYGVAIVWVLLGHLSAGEANVWLGASRAVLAVSSLLGAWVVWDVTTRQAVQQAVDPAPAAGAAQPAAMAVRPVLTGPNGLPVAGWYPDPGRVFDFRYWDGDGWTEHVSRAGVAAISPVASPQPAVRPVAADWYPDPAGRHQWRYWSGDAWTPHVSDDGAHSDDPLGSPAPPPTPHPT